MKAADTKIDVEPSSEFTTLLPDEELHSYYGKVSYLQDMETLPQGRHLGLFSTFVLFVSKMLGSGIFSISSGIYEDCGRSVGIFFFAWFVASIVATSGMYIYLELGSIVPRSGGSKVFLEFIYQKPKLMVTVAYLVYTLITGFSTTNPLVFGEYFLTSLGIDPSFFNIRTTAVIFLFLVAGLHSFSSRVGIKIQNILGGLKIGLLFLMIFTGIYVVFFPSNITNIENQLHWNEVWTVKSKVTAASFASAVIKALFSLAGWDSVHTVANEIDNPTKIIKLAGPIALALVGVSYLMLNLSYLVVIPGSEFAESGYAAGSILFERVFGYYIGRKLLTFSIALCAAGNVFVVLYGVSRNHQEVFREGYVPFARFMASNWPSGAPFRALSFSVIITAALLIFLPDGDIINYLVSYEGYGGNVSTFLVAIGLFIIRHRYPEIRTPIKASKIGTGLVILVSLYLIISPFTGSESPNPQGLQDWPSYALLSALTIMICVGYWWVYFSVLPWIQTYTLKQDEVVLSDGLTIKRWSKVHY